MSQTQASEPPPDIFAVTYNPDTYKSNLIRFNAATPGTITSSVPITGLGGDIVVGIAFRRSTGQLYLLTLYPWSEFSPPLRLYTLNPATGVATLISRQAFGYTNNAYGFNFNPVTDRGRVVSDYDLNLRVNPDSGEAVEDTPLAYAAGDPNAGRKPYIFAAAHSNNFAGATETTLYAIDPHLRVLVRQGSAGGAPISPDTGQLFTIGSLGINQIGPGYVGFDIAAGSNTAYASLPSADGTNTNPPTITDTNLYTINLTTGAATLVGTIGGGQLRGQLIEGIAVAPTGYPATNPIDDTQYFVRQHYLDFLSREPEADGLTAWIGVLNRCTNNTPDCDRIEVSASFFRSAEFYLKGYFVYRFYKVSLGRLPRYAEMLSDMHSVTGQTGAEVTAKKRAFTDGWVQRQAFKDASDQLTNAAFVETLLRPYNVTTITTPDPDSGALVTLTRDALVSDLEAGRRTRAQVLRAIVESREVDAAEYNSAFVAMQYFGYLKRDPEPEGYEAWLRVINRGDSYRVMVNGFVNSIEYRLRFGQP